MASVDLGMPLLPAKSLDITYRETKNLYLTQRLLDGLRVVRKLRRRAAEQVSGDPTLLISASRTGFSVLVRSPVSE